MKLLTWNIQWGRGMDGRVDFGRLLAEIRGMADFDVICLQEVAINFPGLPGSAGEDQMAVLAAGLPGYTPIFAPATDLPDTSGQRRQFGNAIFSRLPVGQVFRHLLPWPAEAGKPSMQRVLLEVVLELASGPIRVMTTHLEYYSRRQRQAQIDAIRAQHAEACAQGRHPRSGKGESGSPFEVRPRPASAILCGDMNFPAEAAERVRLLERFAAGVPAFRDSWEWLNPGQPHAPTVGIHKVDWVKAPSCFDFVFVSEDIAPRLVAHHVNAETAASDHQPVWVALAD
jgi:endonuclease/exonuclease/phosphatase family metal-dependent hydrolase